MFYFLAMVTMSNSMCTKVASVYHVGRLPMLLTVASLIISNKTLSLPWRLFTFNQWHQYRWLDRHRYTVNGEEHNTCNSAIIDIHWLRKVLRFKGWYAISAVFTQLKLRIPRPENVENPRFYQWYTCTSYCLTFLGMRLRFTIITQNQ